MKNKKIAIIFEGHSDNPKGQFNAVIERIRHLKAHASLEADVFAIQIYDGFLSRVLKNAPKRNRTQRAEYHGVQFENLWIDFSIIDYLLMVKLHKHSVFEAAQRRRMVAKFKDYNFLIFMTSSPIIQMIHEKYQIPYTVTWHGSDIHTSPFLNRSVFDYTKYVLEHAYANFFVSRALLEKSVEITPNGNKIVAYNGVDFKIFKVFDCKDRKLCREQFGISSDNVNIAFCGVFNVIKNVDKLPEIFRIVQRRVPNAHFYLAGSGNCQSVMEHGFTEKNVKATFLGNLRPEEMPKLLNAVDLVVLPSKNEGLPLIVVEALACGSRCVAAKVGGIPEVLPPQYCVEHGNDFEQRFADACVKAITEAAPEVPSFISWDKTASIEANTYKNVLH